jgi:hypothetical protein
LPLVLLQNVRKKRDKSNAEATTAIASGAAFCDHQLLFAAVAPLIIRLAKPILSSTYTIASSFKIFAFEGITSVNLLLLLLQTPFFFFLLKGGFSSF